jgi:hypothetical protein
MKKIIQSALIIILGFFIYLSCSDSEKKDDSPSGSAGQFSLGVSLPSSVSEKSSSTSQKIKGKTIEQDLKDAFNPVREFAGIADELAEDVGEMLIEIEVGIAEQGIDFSQEIVVDHAGADMRIQFGPGTIYDKHISAWQKSTATKIIEAQWDGNLSGDNPWAEGYLIMSGGFLGDVPNLMIRMDFNTRDQTNGHTMDVKITGIATEVFTSMTLYAAEKDGLVSVSGNVYIPSMPDDELFMMGQSRNYVFVASADREDNIAVLEVALPDSSIITTDMIFSTYSVGDIYKEAVYNYLTTVDTTLLGILNDYFCEPDITDADTLEACVDGISTSDEGVDAIRFAFDMENPVYLNEDGYVANGEGNSPGSEYDPLDSNNDNLLSLLLAPADVQNLTVEFINLAMPESADFSAKITY